MRILSLGFLLLVGVGVSELALSEDFAEVREIEGYKQWKFTRGPFEVTPGMESLCVHRPFVGHPGTREQGPVQKLKNTLITVYANPIAVEKITSGSKDPFAVGAVILKEKFSDAKSSTPDSLGIMVKREAGFDLKHRDWEFIFLASGKRVARGFSELENCYTCHQSESFAGTKTNDFVFLDLYK